MKITTMTAMTTMKTMIVISLMTVIIIMIVKGIPIMVTGQLFGKGLFHHCLQVIDDG